MNMTDPNTPTTSTNPQDLIDQALGSVATPVSTPTDTTEPTLPTPEPLSPPPATEPMVEQQKPEVEPTNVVPEPTAMPEPPKDVKPMGDDMPLAFANVVTSDTPKVESPVSNINIEQITPAQVPPILTTPSTTDIGSAKPKKRSTKLVAMVVGIFLALSAFSFGGYWLYLTQYSQAAVIAGVFTDTADKDSCNGCLNGGYLVWRNGQCKVTGICGSADNNNDGVGDKDTTNPNDKQIENLGETACRASGSGGQWCQSVDSNGKAYAFCMKNDGSQGNCNNRAIELGYTIMIGKLENASCVCSAKNALGECTSWAMDAASQAAYAPYGQETLAKANELCTKGNGNINFGNGSFLCKEGKIGKGGVVYTGGACTEANGFPFGGNLGCFCGTVQVDTPTGHTSYSSTCGCDKPEATPTPSTPTVTVTPTLMCTGLTHTPTTTPVVGDKLTFTCAGSSTPAGAVNLTYKFRYNLNNGAYVSMTNKTATTSELTIASCGTYKVQCQACGTINGVLTCDPTWTTATQ